MADDWATVGTGIDGPANNAAEITPHDTNDLATASRALVAQVAGVVTVDMVGVGTNIPISIGAGSPLSVRATRVYSTGTTATGIVALW